MPSAMVNDTRKLILETARTLLRRFGADKLTVVDIARALDMSHANVYRFFKNKSEILNAIVDEWMSKMEAFIEAIAGRPASASERIEAVVLELHRKRRQKLLEDAEVYETFRRVVELRPDVIAQRREKIVSVFRRLIEEGVKAGEFAPVDANEAASVLKDATALFLHPFMIPTTLKEETDDRARNVVRYILAGFSAAESKRSGNRRAPALARR
ncbi:MAG TPA: TetR family transcriptional regulator [Verrucomicrobiae bacterium]|nr:TetR family transcriptional regulator [Verrucomicrobiae bacterium]